MINGDFLISLGYKSAPWFKPAIAFANTNNLAGEALLNYLKEMAAANEPKFKPNEKPIPFYKNIKASNEIEAENLKSVEKSMNAILLTPTLVNAAIMPDACPTGENQIPVGGIAVAKNAIHPAMHSADICCSVMLSNFGFISPKEVLDAAHKITHFGAGGRQEYSKLPKDLETQFQNNKFLSNPKILEKSTRDLGTQGDGNHFLFVGISKKTGETMMITHHGSRGVGAQLYKLGMECAEKFRMKLAPQVESKNAWIPFDTKEGNAYWEALQITRTWTKLNHMTLHQATASRLGTNILDNYWNEHNFVFKDNDLFYHAKGATPLLDKFVPDNTTGLRLIPLNMAQPVLIVKGKATANNLGFAPHGAGRNMSRSAHKKQFENLTQEEIFQRETKGLDVRFFSKSIDISELPSAYKDANTVKAQIQEFNLGEIVDEVMPYGCIMAGHQEMQWKNKRTKK